MNKCQQLWMDSTSCCAPQSFIDNTYQQTTNGISELGVIQNPFAELLILRHAPDNHVHERIIKGKPEMFL